MKPKAMRAELAACAKAAREVTERATERLKQVNRHLTSVMDEEEFAPAEVTPIAPLPALRPPPRTR